MSESFERLTTFLILCGLLSMTACEKDTSLDKVPVNEWIYETMAKNYLWNDEMPSLNETNTNAKPAVFFESLLSDKDGKHTSEDDYYYSTIEEDVTTKSAGSIETTHGLHVNYYSVDGTIIVARINYIDPSSPAEIAGLKRGDWIGSYNNIELTQSNYLDFHDYTGSMTLAVGKMNGLDFIKTKEVEVGEAVQMEINPIYIDTTFLVGNKKIAYLMYNSFTSGPTGYDDKTYDNQLQTVFAKFAAQNPDEFILDLRYNSGGVITSAQLLATLLAPQSALGQTFCKLSYNSTLNKTVEYTFDKDVIGNGQNLNLHRLYIITESGTASSSELVINGLKPYLQDELILAGNTTEGKNVGSNEFSDKNNHSWVLHPITCLVSNSEGFSDYTDGFSPDYRINEMHFYGDLGTLGETDEYMLSRTLELIQSGTSSSSFKSAGNPFLQTLPQPQKRFPGILIP